MQNVWPVAFIAALSAVTPLLAAEPAPTQQHAPAASTQAPVDRLSFVNERHGVALYKQLIDTLEQRAAEPQPLPVRGLAGVLVVLRYRGLWVGHGQAAISEVPQLPDGTADLSKVGDLALKRAAEVATIKIRELSLRTRDSDKPDKEPATRFMRFEDAVPTLTLDLQIAHDMTPIVLGDSSSRISVFENFVPGFHGLFASMIPPGETKPRESWIWPGRALSLNLSPESQLVQVAKQLGLPPDAWDILGRPKGPALMRFQCIQVVQGADSIPGQPRPSPVVLTRGNPETPPAGLTRQQVAGLADRIATHLTRRVRSRGDLLGTYFPAGNYYHPETATLEEHAIVALALARYTRRQALIEGKLGRPSLTESALERLVDHVEAQVIPGRKDQFIAAKAMLALALMDAPSLAGRKDLRDRLMNQILGQYRGDAKWVERTEAKAPQPPDREMSATQLAIVLSALSRYHQLVQDPNLEPVIAATFGQLMNGINDQNVREFPIGILPWLAESRGRIGSMVAPDALRSMDQRISNMVVKLREKQVLSLPSQGPDDVIGGFSLRDRIFAGVPDPDWRSAQAIHFIASSLATPGIVTQENHQRTVAACLLGARFIHSLAFAPEATYFMQSPEDSIGGVRLVLYDSKLSPGPSAISLICLMVILDALEQPATLPASETSLPKK